MNARLFWFAAVAEPLGYGISIKGELSRMLSE
jgi:hypothetical protein